MANTLIYYFGDDEAYFRTLKGDFSKHTRLKTEFIRIFESDEKKIQGLFLKVYKDHPACVFIDFSKHSQDYLHLARIISRTLKENEIATVGLVDYLSPPEVLLESIATGVHLTHIKSPECFDVVYDVTKLIAPKEIGEHGFAKATLKEDWEAGVPVKVGYVHNEGLHFECDFAPTKGGIIKLKHHWMTNKIVPSMEVFVQNITNKNLFYHFKHAVDVEFLFIDQFHPPEGMENERIEEKKQEREELVAYHRKQLLRWLDDNASRSLEKKAKVLVIDQDFHFYDDKPRTDKHSYTLRCLPYFEDIGLEFDRLEPQVIAFALDHPEAELQKNTEQQLERMMNAVKNKIQDTSPFVIVFNSESSSKELQDKFSYPNIMSTGSELSVDVLVRMGDIFDKKMTETNLIQKPKVRGKSQVFIRKTNPASISEIMIPIKVLKLSETDMIFQCEHTLKPGMNIHLTSPVDMFVNIQPTKNTQAKNPEYYGLIHALGEDQKQELRRFINSVFFRDHDAQVTAEFEEFKKTNESKLQQKQEAIKRLLEEVEAKKAAEEAAAAEKASAEKKDTEETES
jgi:hypothetical protein